MPSLRLGILITILLLGLLLRVGSAWQGSAEPLPDAAAYERIARGVSEDAAFTQRGPGTPAHPQEASNYSPGLPLLVGLWQRLTGDGGTRSARLMLALLSAISIPLAWILAGRLAPAGCRLPAEAAAAAVAAFYPAPITDAGMLLTEPLAGTLITASLLALLKGGDRPGRVGWWLFAGLLFGLTALLRPEYLLISFLAVGAMLAFSPRQPRRELMVPVAVLAAAFAVTVAPWMIHAGRAAGHPVPASTGGGQTLFTGSVLASGGNPQEVLPDLLDSHPGIAAELERQNRASGEGAEAITPERAFALLAARRFPGLPTDLALARLGSRNYLRALRSEPLALAGFLATKSVRVWWRGRRDLTGSIPGRIVHWLLTALAAGGCLLLVHRRHPDLGPILALTFGATLIGTVLVASPRRALALWPLVAALSGLGASGLLAAARVGISLRNRETVPVA